MVLTRSMNKKTEEAEKAVQKDGAEKAGQKDGAKKAGQKDGAKKAGQKDAAKKARLANLMRPVTANMKSYLTPWTIDDKALMIFLDEDYSIRHPRLEKVGFLARVEWNRRGQIEWENLTDLEKAPYFEKVREQGAKPSTDMY